MSTDTAAERRRSSSPAAPHAGELVIESSWRPADRPSETSVGWMIAHGYLPERRKAASSPHRAP